MPRAKRLNKVFQISRSKFMKHYKIVIWEGEASPFRTMNLKTAQDGNTVR